MGAGLRQQNRRKNQREGATRNLGFVRSALWPEYFLGLRRSFTSTTAKRIEKVDPWKVSFIVPHDETAIRFSGGGDHHIQSASWTSCRSAFRHEARPYKSSFLVKGKHSASKEGLRALRAGEPLFQFFVLFPGRLLQYATMDFCQTERTDVQIAVILTRHPFEKRRGRLGFVIFEDMRSSVTSGFP
jgi:hypothetical protein